MAILRLVAHGVENQEIAQALIYSSTLWPTVCALIYEKLHVTNRTQAALYARDRAGPRWTSRRGKRRRRYPPRSSPLAPFATHYN